MTGRKDVCNVFANNSVGEGMGVKVLGTGLNISTDFKPKFVTDPRQLGS